MSNKIWSIIILFIILFNQITNTTNTNSPESIIMDVRPLINHQKHPSSDLTESFADCFEKILFTTTSLTREQFESSPLICGKFGVFCCNRIDPERQPQHSRIANRKKGYCKLCFAAMYLMTWSLIIIRSPTIVIDCWCMYCCFNCMEIPSHFFSLYCCCCECEDPKYSNTTILYEDPPDVRILKSFWNYQKDSKPRYGTRNNWSICMPCNCGNQKVSLNC